MKPWVLKTAILTLGVIHFGVSALLMLIGTFADTKFLATKK